MKQLFFYFILLSSTAVIAQQKSIQLPYVGDAVRYEKHVQTERKQNALFNDMKQWIENDTNIKILKIDQKNNLITAKGHFTVPAKRSKILITHRFTCVAQKNEILFTFDDFFFPEMGENLEKIIEINSASERKTVQDNLNFIEKGIHGYVAAKTLLFKSFIKEN